jgi:hypothetical protein
MTAEVHKRISEVIPNSIHQWESCLSLKGPDVSNYWEISIGPNGVYHQIVRSSIKKSLSELVNFYPKGMISCYQVRTLIWF